MDRTAEHLKSLELGEPIGQDFVGQSGQTGLNLVWSVMSESDRLYDRDSPLALEDVSDLVESLSAAWLVGFDALTWFLVSHLGTFRNGEIMLLLSGMIRARR